MKNVHFAIPEIYGETLSYYELLRKLVTKMNEVIENYNTVPEQIVEAVANLNASQLFSTVLNQLIHSIATDNTKSANAVKVYKKHDLLYATFNETVNLYESLIDFSTGTSTKLIPGTNIREVNISELFIELRKLIDDEAQAREHGDTTLQTNIDNEARARKQGDQLLQTNIDNEAQARTQADTALQTNISNEAQARLQADNALQTNISNEAQARLQADNALQSSIANGTLKVDKLWTNASPASEFAPQNFNYDLSKYKLIYIVLKRYVSENSLNINAILKVGESAQIISEYSNTIARREIINTDANGITFGKGSSIEVDPDNNFMIPIYIYGIK